MAHGRPIDHRFMIDLVPKHQHDRAALKALEGEGFFRIEPGRGGNLRRNRAIQELCGKAARKQKSKPK